MLNPELKKRRIDKTLKLGPFILAFFFVAKTMKGKRKRSFSISFAYVG